MADQDNDLVSPELRENISQWVKETAEHRENALKSLEPDLEKIKQSLLTDDETEKPGHY